MLATVSVKNIAKTYDGKVFVIKDASFEINDGEFMVLVGPSGCGKSTLLRMIAGLEEISKGDMYIDQTRVNDLPPKDRNIAMVFQNYALYPHMTAYQNMAFGLKLKKVSKAEIDKMVKKAADILEITDLLERKPKAMSGGQRQRIAIGRAIVRDPKVFLFDEPLSNLDAKLRVQMRVELQKLHQRLETTMVYVTHDQTEAMTLGDRIVVLKDGDIMQIGTPMDLYNSPDNMFVAGFIGSPRMNFIEGDEAAKHGAQTIGIRPEHITVSETEGDWSGVVSVSEHLGSDTFFHVHETGLADTITVRADGEVGFRHGDRIHLTPRADVIHRFDAKGLRIE